MHVHNIHLINLSHVHLINFAYFTYLQLEFPTSFQASAEKTIF